MNERIDTAEADDEAALEGLLRAAGSREMPPADVVDQVRQAVHAEWRDAVRGRRRSRFAAYGIAASLAAGIVAAVLVFQPLRSPGEPIATVARIEGALQVADDGSEQWRTVLPGATLLPGAMLRTDAGTRAALDMQGLSVRIDGGSLVELKADDRIALDSGALYVDAGPSGSTPALVVDTLYGAVRHVGTQYELRTLRAGLSVSVREGQVEIERAGEKHAGAAGQQLLVPRVGEIVRESISPQDPRWQWAAGIAPVFVIERQPLTEFLDWVGRETGKRIAYATPEVRMRAEQMILRGSVSNLPPEQALAAVLATTPFQHAQTPDSIRIEL